MAMAPSYMTNNFVSTDPRRNKYAANTTAWPTSTYNPVRPVVQPAGQTLGANTDVPFADPNAQTKSELDVIREKLGAFRAQAESEAGNARQRFQDFSSGVGSRFNTLRDKLEGTVSSSLANLGQERTGVQNLYGRAGGGIRSALESVLRGNRQQARAQGFGDSSFYQDLQGGTRSKFGNQMADLFTEQAGKEAGIGTRETETKNYGETERQSLDTEQTSLVNDAQSTLNSELAQADQLVRSGVIDSQQALNDVMGRHAQRLDSIRDYLTQKDLQSQALAAQYGTKYGGYQAIDPSLQAILSNTSGLDAAKGLASSIPSLANVSGTPGAALGFRGNTGENQRRLEELGLLI